MHVMVLDKEHFPQGQVFHHNKPVMMEFVEGTKQPYVFHMCWTASKVDKLKYMKQVGMWFLTDTCDEGALRSQSYDTGGCCRTDMVPWRVGDGTEIPSIAS
eukprot:CAMPEP_0119526638 /NCGR_PEP_ID=MMETSP1344-20130328/41209_1 /TAXON_ID=236787 /ORGANISM="Florenciella parvula, Strain CCMP2471" /LENGTH=100 /DNA_ID=CAMNT_0007565671 /DNA_START=1 /DNA_END=303 /DNA_ORIENTATION=+